LLTLCILDNVSDQAPTVPPATESAGVMLAEAPDELVGAVRNTITRLARQLRQQSDESITPTQSAALATIKRNGPLTIGALAEHERVAPPTISRVVDKLVDLGLVERHATPRDRRVTIIAISPAGLALMANAKQARNAWLAERLAGFSDAERAHLRDSIELLGRLTERQDL
jgi:DNA-binding MarR family transcriptional regulator